MKSVQNKILSTGFLSLLSLLSVQCGSSTGTSTDDAVSSAPLLTTIDELPETSGPVVDDSSASVSSRSLALRSGPQFSVSATGLNLKTMEGSDFSADSSQAMCETALQVRGSLNEAASADKIMCYVKTIASGFDFDPYDGEVHIFDISGGEGEEGPGEDFRVKMQITRDATTQVITDFIMQSCEAGTQSEYLHYSIDSDGIEVVSKYVYDDEFGSGSQQMTMTGQANDDGELTEKTLVASFNNDWGDGTGYGNKTFHQFADHVIIELANAGTWTWNDPENPENSAEGSFGTRAYSYAQIANDDSLVTFDIGSGAARGISTGTFGDDDEVYSQEFSEGWDGATTLIDVDSALLALVSSATIPDAPVQEAIAFTGDEIYDCGDGNDDGDDNDAIQISMGEDTLAGIQECNTNLELGWDFFNCYDIVENGNVPEAE